MLIKSSLRPHKVIASPRLVPLIVNHRTLASTTHFKMGFKTTDWVDPNDKSGEFKRKPSAFRNFIKKGGEFPPEKDRYHLYVSYACPWAHRVLIVRQLKGLEDILPYTSVHWHMLEKGWRFATASDDDAPGDQVTPDPVEGHEKFTHLRDLYWQVDPDYKGRFTVPTLYDKKRKTVVSNESSEIIRMLYSEYRDIHLLPEDLELSIDSTNDWVYNDINNGVYLTGFATTQAAYEKNLRTLFTSLDRVEAHLVTQQQQQKSNGPDAGPYYFGSRLTEVDVRLFTTIVRFDAIYVQHFKANLRDIRSGYPAIHRWLRHLYWNHAAFRDTTNFTHIKRHYSKSHHQINPKEITPVGPDPDILPEDKEVAAVMQAVSVSKEG